VNAVISNFDTKKIRQMTKTSQQNKQAGGYIKFKHVFLSNTYLWFLV